MLLQILNRLDKLENQKELLGTKGALNDYSEPQKGKKREPLEE
ncbi:16618_t:CDS:2, partial [Dentiscutata erythropus]